jgi:methionyl-tRNA formyltransferase
LNKKNKIVIITKKIWHPKNYKVVLKKNFIILDKLNYQKIKKIDPRIIFFIHWSKIIEKKFFENYECIQFHSTNLPFGRGGSPIQNQILMGIKNTKITAFKMGKKIDDGPFIIKRPLKLKDSAQKIYTNMEKISLEMIMKISKMKKLIYKKQKGKVVIFKRRLKNQSEIKFNKINNIKKLYDYIRMLDADNYPKAFVKLNPYIAKLSNAKLINGILKATIEFKKNDKK